MSRTSGGPNPESLGCCFLNCWYSVSCRFGLWVLAFSLSLIFAMVTSFWVVLLSLLVLLCGAVFLLLLLWVGCPLCCFGWCCCSILLWCDAVFPFRVVLPSPPPCGWSCFPSHPPPPPPSSPPLLPPLPSPPPPRHSQRWGEPKGGGAKGALLRDASGDMTPKETCTCRVRARGGG